MVDRMTEVTGLAKAFTDERKAARAEGFKAGAEAMRETVLKHVRENRVGVDGHLERSDTFITIAQQNQMTAISALPIPGGFKAGAEGATQWRDIQDAPKDGTPVLLFANGAIYIGAFAQWHGHGGIEAEGWNKQGFNFPSGSIEPTLWHSLPAPPEDKP
jgi:hypothetical protein